MEKETSNVEHNVLYLERKKTARLYYSFSNGDSDNEILIVFINGLMVPRSGWEPTIERVVQIRQEKGRTLPAMLAYDRFGQGDSDPDPTDKGDQTHSLDDAVHDLHDFVAQFRQQMNMQNKRLVFVCNSIGCPIARLFDQVYPGNVSAFLFLDSMMANTDFVSLIPDPDATDFDEKALPADVTSNDLRKAREITQKVFYPSVPNKEKLDRSNTSTLLPYSDRPALSGSAGRGPLLTVVGHDWEVFAAENEVAFLAPNTRHAVTDVTPHRRAWVFRSRSFRPTSIRTGTNTIKDWSD